MFALTSPPLHGLSPGRPDESGQSGGQRRRHVGAEGQECGPGSGGHGAPEPGDRCCHPVRPVHLAACRMCQGTAARLSVCLGDV